MSRRKRGIGWRLPVCVLSLLVAGAAGAQSPPPRSLTFVEVITAPDEAVVRWPVAVASAPDGSVAVADAFGNRIVRFGALGGSWAFEGETTLPAAPAALTHDGSRFVVALRRPGDLLALEDDGEPRPIRVRPGISATALAAVRDGSILAFDSATLSIVEIDPSGVESRRVRVGLPLTAIAAGPQGGFFGTVAEPPARLLALAADGSVRASWELPGDGPVPAWPTGVAVEPGGDLLVVDGHGHRILVFDALGRWVGLGSRSGWQPGLLRRPAAIAALPGGRYLIADLGNSRVQVFRRVGRTAP